MSGEILSPSPNSPATLQRPYELKIFRDAEDLANCAARFLLQELSQRQNYTIGLSGGRISKVFLEKLTIHSKDNGTQWLGVHFFWCDERAVPPTDLDSNFRVAQEAFLQPMKVAEDQIHRIHAEIPDFGAGEAEA